MHAMDEYVMRKRRDRLFNPATAPYEQLFGALFVYQQPPPLVPAIGVAPPVVPAAVPPPPAAPPPLPPSPPVKTEEDEVAELLRQALAYDAANPESTVKSEAVKSEGSGVPFDFRTPNHQGDGPPDPPMFVSTPRQPQPDFATVKADLLAKLRGAGAAELEDRVNSGVLVRWARLISLNMRYGRDTTAHKSTLQAIKQELDGRGIAERLDADAVQTTDTPGGIATDPARRPRGFSHELARQLKPSRGKGNQTTGVAGVWRGEPEVGARPPHVAPVPMRPDITTTLPPVALTNPLFPVDNLDPQLPSLLSNRPRGNHFSVAFQPTPDLSQVASIRNSLGQTTDRYGNRDRTSYIKEPRRSSRFHPYERPQ